MFALHPGRIRSKNDGDIHYISVARLADLYELRPSEWINWDRQGQGRRWEDYRHLGPDYEGNYGRPI